MADYDEFKMTDEEWNTSWQKEAPQLTLEEYKAECLRQFQWLKSTFLNNDKFNRE